MSHSELRADQVINDLESDDPIGFFQPTQVRVITDPIHDQIPIHSYLARFIDTKPFQRLRSVKQLGTTSYVWPSATHTRFEHSLGVAFLARYVTSHLQRHQPELGITHRDIACIEIAGLCHDLGHGPWSHVWDSMFMPKALPHTKWKHEIGSEMMFDFLVESANIPLREKDTMFIKALIAGDPDKCSSDEKPFLFDIVANRRNGFDVDKLDYIQRDHRMTGGSVNLSITRILNSAKVLNNEICYDIKDANQIYEIYGERFKMHKLMYNHKSAKAIEHMIIDGLLAANHHLKIAERVFDPKKYLYLTDVIMNVIEASTEPELEESRKVFERIRVRDLYRCVDFKVVDWSMCSAFKEFVTPERIVQAVQGLSLTLPVIQTFEPEPLILDDTTDNFGQEDRDENAVLTVDDIIVDIAFMHYGMKDKNPLDFIMFYSKKKPNQPARAGPGVYSNLMPSVFAEGLLRVYTKKSNFFGMVQAGYRAVLDDMLSMEKKKNPSSFSSDEGDNSDTHIGRRGSEDTSTTIRDDDTLTPPITMAPSPSHPHPQHSKAPSRTFGRTTSVHELFSNNNFTTVSPNYVHASPLAGTRRGDLRITGSRSPDRGRVRGTQMRMDDNEDNFPAAPQGTGKRKAGDDDIDGGGGEATATKSKRTKQDEGASVGTLDMGRNGGGRRRGQ